MYGHLLLTLLSLLPFWLAFNAVAPLLSPGVTTHCYARVETNSVNGVKDGAGNYTCMRVSGGRIKSLFRGEQEGAGYAFPAFWDGHGHVLGYGEMVQSVKLYGAGSIDEVKTRIKDYLSTHPSHGTKEKWIRGIGWDQANFNGVMPTAKAFEEDPELKGLYIMVDRVDVHCTWVSEAVLKLLPDPVPDVPGGEVVRVPGLGVFCDNAMDGLPYAHWPRPTRADKVVFVQEATKALHAAGIVGVHDAGVVPEDMELYNSMAGAGLLNLRIYGMYECPVRNTFCGNITRKIEREDGMLAARSVKLFADGALGSWGAALLEPYSDKPDTSGTMLIEEPTLNEVVKQWYEADYQINIHAIGDRAARAALHSFQNVLTSTCPPPNYVTSPALLHTHLTTCLTSTQDSRRLRLEHSQIVHPAEQALMQRLGIIASVQPTHATSDSAYALSRLGEERVARRAYRLRSFVEMGVPLVLGSDFPVEPVTVLGGGVYAAVTRRSPAGGEPWCEGEALGVWEALQGFWRGAAYAGFMEGLGAGELSVGGWADWVVLDADLGGLEGEEVGGVKVLETWVAGRRVFCGGCEKAWWREVWEWKGWWGWGLRVEKVMGEVEKVLGQHGL